MPPAPPKSVPPGRPDRWILHVDMDAFFASVEALDDPNLRGRPLIVGGAGRRGVVASCSYEARVYGVRSAMPSGQARRLCPGAVFVAGRYARYAEVSRQMHAIFQRFTPVVEGISLDEAFLDITGSLRLFGPPETAARSIRTAIHDELGLTCSVGGATVKFLAKLASEAAKPAVDGARRHEDGGVLIVPPGGEIDFLHPHPIEALWGVGPATAARLRQLGIGTIRDLAGVDPSVVEGAVGRAAGAHLARLARGVDERRIEPHREVKSVSHEETYPVDRRDSDGLRIEVMRMADSVATRLRTAQLAGRTVTLKVRFGDFSTITRSVTSPLAIDEAPEIAGLAGTLLAQLDLVDGVRLLGVGVSNLFAAGAGPGEQLTLDLDVPAAGTSAGPLPWPPVAAAPSGSAGSARPLAGPLPWPAAAAIPARHRPRVASPSRPGVSTTAAVDAIRDRYGPDAVGSAALLGRDGIRVKRPGDTQWGPEPHGDVASGQPHKGHKG